MKTEETYPYYSNSATKIVPNLDNISDVILELTDEALSKDMVTFLKKEDWIRLRLDTTIYAAEEHGFYVVVSFVDSEERMLNMFINTSRSEDVA